MNLFSILLVCGGVIIGTVLGVILLFSTMTAARNQGEIVWLSPDELKEIKTIIGVSSQGMPFVIYSEQGVTLSTFPLEEALSSERDEEMGYIT